MEFNTLFEAMLFGESCTYILMGVTLLVHVGFFCFISGRDKPSSPAGHKEH